MLNEFDVVTTKKSLSNRVYKGASGTVLMCHPNNDYEVEFMEEDGETLDVLTVAGSDLMLEIPFKKD